MLEAEYIGQIRWGKAARARIDMYSLGEVRQLRLGQMSLGVDRQFR